MRKMNNVIVAFDMSDEKTFLELLDTFSQPIYVKVGMESIYRFGLPIIEKIKERGHFIFLDLKLHDIPNTVYHAMKNLAKWNIDMVNVHAAGGVEMMKAACKGVKEVNPNILCIAVTILKSLDENEVRNELQIEKTPQEAALTYALHAKAAGMDGVVCSVHEVEAIHQVCGNDFLCVTPGIALPTTGKNDQKRVATPALAKQMGANYIVVGRAITSSADPYETYRMIKKEMTV